MDDQSAPRSRFGRLAARSGAKILDPASRNRWTAANWFAAADARVAAATLLIKAGTGEVIGLACSQAWPAVVYFVPQYVMPVAPAPEYVPAPAPVEQPTPTGRLILGAQPDNAQVFVDGYYAGVPEDFNLAQGGGVLEAGQHRIDVRAPGYEALSVDVRIAPNQSVTYRDTLKKDPAACRTERADDVLPDSGLLHGERSAEGSTAARDLRFRPRRRV